MATMILNQYEVDPSSWPPPAPTTI